MKIAIIIGSVREGRSSATVAKWVENTAKRTQADVELSVIDLYELGLPMFDEAISPKYNPNRQPEGNVKVWLDALADADGYVIVTPEYNHSIPGSLKNAVDFVDYQMTKKAAAIVSHGSVGGARAAEHLRNIASELGLVTTPTAVHIVGMIAMGGVMTEDGELVNKESGAQQVLEATLNDLVWYTGALSAAK